MSAPVPELKINSIDHGAFSSEPGSRIVRCQSRMRMTIYPQEDPVFSNRSMDARRITFSDEKQSEYSLRKFTWTKTLGKAAGQWQAVIKADKRFGKLDPMKGDILPGDWVEIELIRDGTAIPVCIGIIDTINRDRRSNKGATVVHWQVTGRDHGKIFEYPITYANIFAQTLGEVVKGLMTERVKGKIGGSPAEMFKVLIEAAFNPGTTSSLWQLPPSLASAKGYADNANVLDILAIEDFHSTVGHYYNEVQLWNKAGQTLYQALGFWCFPLMHRMTFDVAERGTHVKAVIREHPYINLDDGPVSEWFSLPEWKIPSWLPVGDNLARSDGERANIVQLLSNVGWEGSSAEQAATAPPKYAKKSIERHGLRPLNESTHFIGGASKSAFNQYRTLQQTKLMEWHAANPYFLSGQVNLTIPIPEARIGHRLLIESGAPADNINLYIEGTTLEYQASMNENEPPTANQSFVVTRGYMGTDRDGLSLIQKASSIYADLLFKSTTGAPLPSYSA